MPTRKPSYDLLSLPEEVVVKPQYIEFVETTATPFFYQPKWYEALQVWLIRKLGGTHPCDTIKYVRIPIDGKTFVEKLFKQHEDFIKNLRPEPTRILIGAEDFQKLMGSPEFNQPFSFMAEFGYSRTLYGLKVDVIPWMRGMLIMP